MSAGQDIHCQENQLAKVANRTVRVLITGFIQGLGVRPSIYNLATRLGVAGTVRNTSQGVEVVAAGPRRQVTAFIDQLADALPELAKVEGIHVEDIQVEDIQVEGIHVAGLHGEPRPVSDPTRFRILREPSTGPLVVRVPPDLAACSACLHEVLTPTDRRYRYPLNSCTHCGPRYSIIREMPYERPESTMSEFLLCPACRHEYRQPSARRFHAQTVCCPNCGPRVWCVNADEQVMGRGDHALRAALVALRTGKIVALRGLGGYQLITDATNANAIERLRERKGRPAKPLAVMVDSLAAADNIAWLDEQERAALCDASNPIVLLRAKATPARQTSAGQPHLASHIVHPGLDIVGVMLPTTPLHALLLHDFGRPIVCTSGNREGCPLEFEVDAAQRNLAGLCDVWLHHDRPIARPIDDSVVRVIAGRRVSIRLARGLAPLPLDLPATPPIVALGGHLKSALAWSNGSQAVLGPHLGDQETVNARERYIVQYQQVQELYRFAPTQLVRDFHPDYFTTGFALRQQLPQIAIQHHHAHVVAGMLEHGWLDREVLGVSWDGTGYGTDGTIWGGEFLICTATAFRRLGSLRPFRLPGGEAAIHQPWRTALSVACDVLAEDDVFGLPFWDSHDDVRTMRGVLQRPAFSPWTTSAGRLFDAAAAIVLGIRRSQYEGFAAMRLEAAADASATGQYHAPVVRRDDMHELDWRPLVAGLIRDQSAQVPASTIAMRFHRTLAAGIVSMCRVSQPRPVVLTGGVFQNRLLTELIHQMLSDEGYEVGLPGRIPPNDGGLAAGQLAVAACLYVAQ